MISSISAAEDRNPRSPFCEDFVTIVLQTISFDPSMTRSRLMERTRRRFPIQANAIWIRKRLVFTGWTVTGV
jgi:hypothetical protein